jgi:uncharacterized membrane protein YqjE
MGREMVTRAPTSELVGDLVERLSALAARHLQLFRVEAAAQAKAELKAATSFMVAAGAASAGLLFLLAGGALALALVLPAWAATLIVGGLLFVVAGAAGLIGYQKRVRKPLRHTRETLQEDARWLRAPTV